MILIIDNYDSFTYNLYQMIGKINNDIKVIRNDEMTINEIEKLKPSHIIISPGPKTPDDAGICLEVIKTLSKKIPTLGICLGHQSIYQAFGGKVVLAEKPIHGKQSAALLNTKTKLFKGMKEVIDVARYHSLIADSTNVPENIEVIATTTKGEIMALKHKKYSIYGLQFHPESILTNDGEKIIRNFLEVQ